MAQESRQASTHNDDHGSCLGLFPSQLCLLPLTGRGCMDLHTRSSIQLLASHWPLPSLPHFGLPRPRASKPDGRFQPHSAGASTPDSRTMLDSIFYQISLGRLCVTPLSLVSVAAAAAVLFLPLVRFSNFMKHRRIES